MKIEGKKMDSPVTHSPVIVPVLLLLLVGAVFMGNETGMRFQYRQQARWSGPWENPNGFGMLMAAGVVLAVGTIASIARGNIEHRTLNIQHRTSGRAKVECGNLGPGIPEWGRIIFFTAAAVVCGIGLIKSYSRGAWLGTVVGLGYVGWQLWGRQKLEVRSEKLKSSSRDSRDSWVGPWRRQSAGPLGVIAVSLFVISFWSFRHTEQVVARRAFSMGNVNDFSLRNRVAAWVGALQIMAERPWLGQGWNQGERIYDQFYRAPNVPEGMAIQLNDYLMLGASSGLPALVCLLAYVGLALGRKSEVRSQKSEGWSPNTRHSLPGTTCHAGAVVLLISFWFDGGLFRLAPATVFWVLLELGREHGPRMTRRDANDSRPYAQG